MYLPLGTGGSFAFFAFFALDGLTLGLAFTPIGLLLALGPLIYIQIINTFAGCGAHIADGSALLLFRLQFF